MKFSLLLTATSQPSHGPSLKIMIALTLCVLALILLVIMASLVIFIFWKKHKLVAKLTNQGGREEGRTRENGWKDETALGKYETSLFNECFYQLLYFAVVVQLHREYSHNKHDWAFPLTLKVFR